MHSIAQQNMIIITNAAQTSKPRDYTQANNRYAKILLRKRICPNLMKYFSQKRNKVINL